MRYRSFTEGAMSEEKKYKENYKLGIVYAKLVH